MNCPSMPNCYFSNKYNVTGMSNNVQSYFIMHIQDFIKCLLGVRLLFV